MAIGNARSKIGSGDASERGRRARWWTRTGKSYRSFKYFDAGGRQIRDRDTIERINSLAIPPAWTSVRICPSPGGRLQAVGTDDAGRTQYIYHSSFVSKRKRKNFAKIERFGSYLPRLRRQSNRDIRLKGFPKAKVLAIMVRLVNALYMRVGAEHSARKFRTYGITTLKNEHLTIRNNHELIFDYVGKSYVKHRKVMADKKMALVMAELRRVGSSKKLFHYIDENDTARPVTQTALNQYLKEATSPEFTLKDFRTWGATLLAAVKFAEIGPADSETQVKKNTVRVIREVAEELGNTMAVCRTSYIHPEIVNAYARGITISEFTPGTQRSVKKFEPRLTPEEKALIKFFKEKSRA